MENKVKVSSILTKDLSRNDIISICKIKKEQYKFSLNDQIKWFKKKITFTIWFVKITKL